MILLNMVIMNLSVAAVIEGLAEASKENTGVVSGDQIDFLIGVWKDYDINATGLISYRDFLFLLYEVPPPLGLGPFKNYHSEIGGEGGHIDNEEDEDKKEDLKHINNLGLQDRYIIHEKKKIYIKKSDAIKIFNDYAIPLFDDESVHFKDVAKALVEKIFKKNKLSYDLTGKILGRLNKQWAGKYTSLKKNTAIEGIDTGVVEAGKAILKFYMKARENQDNTNIKRYKSMKKNTQQFYTSAKAPKRKSINEGFKFEETKAFTPRHVEKFIKEGETNDVKMDKDYDVFRYLMQNKFSITYDKDHYINSIKPHKQSELKFTWFKDPNFKIDEEDGDSEDENKESLKFSSLNPHPQRRNQRSPFLTRYPIQSKLKQLGSNINAKHNNNQTDSKLQIPNFQSYHETRPPSPTKNSLGTLRLQDPQNSKLFERREQIKKLSKNSMNFKC